MKSWTLFFIKSSTPSSQTSNRKKVIECTLILRKLLYLSRYIYIYILYLRGYRLNKIYNSWNYECIFILIVIHIYKDVIFNTICPSISELQIGYYVFSDNRFENIDIFKYDILSIYFFKFSRWIVLKMLYIKMWSTKNDKSFTRTWFGSWKNLLGHNHLPNFDKWSFV